MNQQEEARPPGRDAAWRVLGVPVPYNQAKRLRDLHHFTFFFFTFTVSVKVLIHAGRLEVDRVEFGQLDLIL